LVWPAAIAPAKVYLAPLGTDEAVVKAADALYDHLTQSGIAVLYDDRDVRAGEKFADADLYGIPHRIVISAKTLQEDKYELKSRTSDETHILNRDELRTMLDT
jgi:prolyl-tRNA synthetase